MKKVRFFVVNMMIASLLFSGSLLPVVVACAESATTPADAESAASATAPAGPAYGDIAGHWARAAIERWSGLSVLLGSDGLFRPDDIITRAELAAIINRIMKFPSTEETFFPDISGKWYESDINALARQSVYLVRSGPSGSDLPLTREEAVGMLYKSFASGEAPHIWYRQTPFTDEDDVSSEYATAVSAFRQLGFISGFEDGSFRPKEFFTRAQVVTILNNIIGIYITEPGSYKIPPLSNVCVAAPGVKLNFVDASYIAVLPAASEGLTIFERYPTFGVYWGSGYSFESEFFRIEMPRTNTSNSINTLNYRSLRYDSDDAFIDKGFAGGSGHQNDPYLIENEAQLRLLDNYLSEDYKDFYFTLTNDIMLESNWTPIGSEAGLFDYMRMTTANKGAFCGTLDGAGFSIYNMVIDYNGDDRSAFGLFVYINGTVKNLSVSGAVSIDSPITGIGGADFTVAVGGIAGSVGNRGSLKALIENCSANVSIDVKGLAGVHAGGVVGDIESDGTVRRSSSSGRISAYSAGAEEPDYACAGGIAGYMGYGSFTARLSESYSDANVIASGGFQCYAGGIVGAAAKYSAIENCLASADVLAKDSAWQNNAGGIAGLIDTNFASIRTSGSFSNVSASGRPNYFNAAGGIAGSAYLKSNISNCFSAGAITTENDSVAGGIVGRAEFRIYACYTTTRINAPQARNNYKANGLYGWERDYLEVVGCGVFNVDEPYFLHHEDGIDEYEITLVESRPLNELSTYNELGGDKWAKNEWIFDSTADYPYAIPRGIAGLMERYRKINKP